MEIQLTPSDRALVLAVDERNQIRALDRTRSELSLILAPPAEKANAKVHPFHSRQGIHILGGAVSPPSGGFDADGFFRKSLWMVGNGASC
ncbi:Transposase (plasmid) [Roseomonas mucosa]|nr:Transposase [Roseomonas mucosa]QDD97858.1 Transposase [Roseomonas mucosa]UZO94207.1 Transposase [Roseomonas mucosa]